MQCSYTHTCHPGFYDIALCASSVLVTPASMSSAPMTFTVQWHNVEHSDHRNGIHCNKCAPCGANQQHSNNNNPWCLHRIPKPAKRRPNEAVQWSVAYVHAPIRPAEPTPPSSRPVLLPYPPTSKPHSTPPLNPQLPCPRYNAPLPRRNTFLPRPLRRRRPRDQRPHQGPTLRSASVCFRSLRGRVR